MNLSIEEFEARDQRPIDVVPPPLPPVDELRKIALDDRPDIVAVPPWRRASRRRCPAGQGQRLQRRLCPLAAVYLPGQQPYGVKTPVLGAGRDRSAADLQPQPGRYRPGQDERRSIADAARRFERQALIDIEEAIQEYEVSRRLIQELKEQIIPERGRSRPTPTSSAGGSLSVIDVIDAQLDFNDKVNNISTPRSDTAAACCRSIRWWARDHALREIGTRTLIDRGSGSSPGRDRREETMGRRIAAACGPTSSCSSAGSCSRRSPTSWPATASTARPDARSPGAPAVPAARISPASVLAGRTRRSIRAPSSIRTARSTTWRSPPRGPEAG